jgi:hypothetical protein
MPQVLTYKIAFSQPCPLAGLVSASHHVSLSDVVNGYCLHFFTAPKDFNK